MHPASALNPQPFVEDGDQPWLMQTNQISTPRDMVQLRHYALDLMGERAPVLMEVFRYYESLRNDPFLPPGRDNFDAKVPMKLGLGNSVNIIDITEPAIENAWFRMQADTRFVGVHQRRGLRAAEFPFAIYRELILQNLLTMRETAAVGFGRMTARLGDRLYDYWRLALPFSGDGTQVAQVMTVVVNQHPNVYRLLR